MVFKYTKTYRQTKYIRARRNVKYLISIVIQKVIPVHYRLVNRAYGITLYVHTYSMYFIVTIILQQLKTLLETKPSLDTVSPSRYYCMHITGAAII